MNKTQRKILHAELHQALEKTFGEVQQEALFSTIMSTKRRFRADFYVPAKRIVIEINGGQWVSGRHNRGGKGYENDLTKSNLANANNFVYLQYTYEMLARGEHLADMKKLADGI